MVIEKKLLQSSTQSHWERIGIKHHHGFATPLFCLISEQSCGIGEYTDLIPLIKWCKEIGFDIIQLLPINDTGISSSPYAAISAFALNPIHLSLDSLPRVKRHKDLMIRMAELRTFNKTERVDYASVYRKKEFFLREYFAKEGPEITQSAHFKEFQEKHNWLPGFALFKALKIKYNWALCKDWPKNPNPKDHEDEILYHSFVQYLCFTQMHGVDDIAINSGVLLTGDIPISIGYESADVWLYPELFDLNYSAGAPPDAFSADGQEWGVPIYNWQEMEKQDYSWWKKRLQVTSLFFDAYRIDHIVGFYRIWAVPRGCNCKEGNYMPNNPEAWLQLGEKNMQMMLEATEMFPIAEDLGHIPKNVTKSLKDMGIPGMKIMRWERYWDDDHSYIPFDQYPALAMTTVTTHDMEPLYIWWERHPEDAKAFCRLMSWDYEPELSEQRHKQILLANHRLPCLFHINLMQEYLSLFPELSRENPADDRINLPGTVSPLNWTAKLRPTIEEFTSHEGLKKAMQEMSGKLL